MPLTQSMMNSPDDFLAPVCSVDSLERFVVRRSLLQAITNVLPRLHGTVLDVGCGRMPYKSLVLAPRGCATTYIGLDLARANYLTQPDLAWDGIRIPLAAASVDCALATEVFEHCPEPELVMREINRVLKPGGLLFLTVPFLWPLHEVPHDEYRYTPFALERHLRNSGFDSIQLQALGGWDASLAQMLSLWVRRRPFTPLKRRLLTVLTIPIVRFLLRYDYRPSMFGESTMITGLSGTACKGSQ